MHCPTRQNRIESIEPLVAMVFGTNRNCGFSLTELLVVMAVIGVLASLLLPVLSKTKYQGQRVVCVSNIRQQYLSQFLYADDYQGRFANHEDQSPDYHRTPLTGKSSIVNCLRGTYLRDTKITICPITAASFGKYWEYYGDPAAYDTPGYGGWDTQADMVVTSYLWFANYTAKPAMKFLTTEGKVDPADPSSEPPWPSKTSECDSRRAFITHRVSESPFLAFSDLGHLGGFQSTWEQRSFSSWSITVDQPVGYADGHIVIRKRADLRPRAKGSVTRDTVFFY
jgi:prepilin-type N-terminal cleavage/methylation domain-containing protein